MIDFEIEKHGTVFRKHTGSGNVIGRSGEHFPCRFELVQYADGRIRAFCQIEPDSVEALAQSPHQPRTGDFETIGFNGICHGGYQIEAFSPTIINTHYHQSVGKPVEWGYTINLTAASFALPTLSPISTTRFHIVNFDFLPIPHSPIKHPTGIECDASNLPLTFSGSNLFIEAVAGKRQILDNLKNIAGIGVTCSITLFEEPTPTVEALINNVCTVLTLLQCTRINWICYDAISTNGYVTKSFWRNSSTGPFSHITLINRLSDSDRFITLTGEGLKYRIEILYGNLDKAEKEWRATEIINLYASAVTAPVFLELGALSLVGIMEVLRETFLSFSQGGYILSPDVFTRTKHDKIAKKIREVLREELPHSLFPPDVTEKDWQELILRMSTHVQGFNRHPFKHVIEQMCQQVGMIEPKEENSQQSLQTTVKLFGDIRDHIVHRGQFLVPTEPNEVEGWTERRMLTARWNQYRFIEQFVGAFLLSMLGLPQKLPLLPADTFISKQ